MAAKKRRTKKPAADLREYRRKRDFGVTPEPAGQGGGASVTGRLFVVQKHAASSLHYDLRLELDGVLKSWAVPRGPSLDPAQKPLAVLVEDHPMEYAGFEGIIPEGEYGGGTVMVWDCGEWTPDGDPHAGLAKGDLKFTLHGEKLRGAWVLARMSGDASEGGRNWLLIKKKDDDARSVSTYNVQSELPFSVTSGRTMDQIAAAPEAVWTDGGARTAEGAAAGGAAGGSAVPVTADLPDPADLTNARPAASPRTLAPQLAGTAATAPDGDRWLHELKLDGYRLLCHVDGGTVRLLTRNGHDWTGSFPAVARAAGRLPVESVVLDGEVVVLDRAGHPDFGALQEAIGGGGRRAFTYFVFDVPYAQGHDLRSVPLLDRKTWLETLLRAAPMVAPTIEYSKHIVGHGPTVFDQAARAEFEGIMSKRVDAPYESRRADTWVKVKHRPRQEFVVGGWTDPSGSRAGFGALLVGFHDTEGRLVYAGRVGSGFRDAMLDRLAAMLDERAIETPPFVNPELDPGAADAHWVRPELVVEVEYTSWTRDTLLRHPVFLGLRPDADPAAVVREPTPAPRPPAENAPDAKTPRAGGVIEAPVSPEDAMIGGVRISNPGRTVYPEARVTKGEVAAYYDRIADWILPHVARRPLSLVRCPLGLAGESFFQRHVGDGFPPGIRGVPHGAEIEGEPYLLIDDHAGLLALVQMGVLEIHTWGCREDDLEQPDTLVFDLDPGPGIEWAHVVASADFVRRYLDDAGLRSFVKTSGGQGLHVVVPIVRRAGWPPARAFALAVAKDLAKRAPRNFVATMSKAFRKNRVFVDYLRNVRGATAIAPYSTRARPGACVSTPLGWDELSADHPPTDFTVRTVPDRLERLDADPWDDFRRTRQSLSARVLRAVGVSERSG